MVQILYYYLLAEQGDDKHGDNTSLFLWRKWLSISNNLIFFTCEIKVYQSSVKRAQ